MPGSVVERGKGRWFLRVDAGRDPVSGKRRQATRTVAARNLTEARAALARFAVEVGQGGHGRGTDARTVADACREWLEVATPGLAANTAATFADSLRRYALGRIGEVRLSKLQTHDLDRLYAELLAGGGRGGRPLSASTVRKVHVPLSLALGQALRWGWIGANPAAAARAPAEPKSVISPPEVQACRKLLEVAEAKDPEWAMFLRLAAATGRRRGELCALRWDAVDLDGATVTIRRTVEIVPGEGVPVREWPKSAAGVRQIAIDPATVEVLRAGRQRQASAAAACGVALGAGAFVFSTDPAGRRPWDPRLATHRFTRLRREAGLGDTVRLHDLRHYVATQLLAAGYDPVSVAGRLGHDPKMLLSTYAHWVPARDRDQAAFLGSLLDGPPKPSTDLPQAG